MGQALSVLLIGECSDLLPEIKHSLRNTGFDPQVTHSTNMAQAHAKLRECEFDLIICDHRLNNACHQGIAAQTACGTRRVPLVMICDGVNAFAAEAAAAGAGDMTAWLPHQHLSVGLGAVTHRVLNQARACQEHSEAVRLLEHSQRSYHELANALPQTVFQTDEEGFFTFVNRRGLEVFGYCEDDIAAGTHISRIIAADQVERAMAQVREVIRGRTFSEGTEYTAIRKDGSPVPVMVYVTPVIREGEPEGVLGVAVDLTEIKQAEEQLRANERRYRTLVDAMGDGLISIDRGGIITYGNQALADMLGVSVDNLVGANVRDLVDHENVAILERHLHERFVLGRSAPASYELEVTGACGERLTMLVTSTSLYDDEGTISGSLAVVKNVTERRVTRERLLQIKAGLDAAGEAIGIVDAQHRVTYVNHAFEELFGCTAEQLTQLGGPSALAADPEHYRQAQEALERVGSFSDETYLRTASGRIFPALIRVNEVRDDNGRFAGLVSVLTDVSERREREQQLRLANARLELINSLGQRLNSGESLDSIILAGANGLRALLEVDYVIVLLRETQPESGEVFVVRCVSTMPDEAARMREALGASLEGTAMRLKPGSPGARAYAQVDSVEARGTTAVAEMAASVEILGTPELGPAMLEATQQRQVRYLFSTPLVRESEIIGYLTLLDQDTRPLSDDEKQLMRTFAGQLAVILDKARTEAALVRLNQLHQGIIDNAAVWFTVFDSDGRILVWNRAAEEISGYRRDEADGEDIVQRLCPDAQMRSEMLEAIRRALSDDEELSEFEGSIRCKNGETRTMSWSLRRLRGAAADDRSGLIIIGRDITESRELQDQLRRSQRMEAIGTLAGGIAHDFNNILTAIIGHADLLSAEVEEDSRSQWHALQIADAAERASRLTRQLLAFSRRQPARPQIVDLNRVISGMEEIFRRLIPEDVGLCFQLAPDLGYTKVDPAHVEQVIMNLVVNARDAMPAGGILTIATSNATLSEDQMTQLFDAKPGQYVTLSVSDTGVGMSEAVEARIFEPFFTTKAETGGTGLGLATVYGIVRQNSGVITVYSEPGEGSVFRVYLPRSDGSRTAAPSPLATDRDALRGAETVLVVEDAENLRSLVRTMLTTLGYTVLSAASGPEALELTARNAGQIDLLITDVIMPEMSGTELADQLIEQHPTMRVLYVSGYPSERAITAGNDDPRFSFLQKPFSALALGRKLREILGMGKPLS
ncbi:MAG: PAS domain S-box protein [Armatimonadota bacterium]